MGTLRRASGPVAVVVLAKALSSACDEAALPLHLDAPLASWGVLIIASRRLDENHEDRDHLPKAMRRWCGSLHWT
jgi:hypothetical protein